MQGVKPSKTFPNVLVKYWTRFASFTTLLLYIWFLHEHGVEFYLYRRKSWLKYDTNYSTVKWEIYILMHLQWFHRFHFFALFKNGKMH